MTLAVASLINSDTANSCCGTSRKLNTCARVGLFVLDIVIFSTMVGIGRGGLGGSGMSSTVAWSLIGSGAFVGLTSFVSVIIACNQNKCCNLVETSVDMAANEGTAYMEQCPAARPIAAGDRIYALPGDGSNSLWA